MINNETLEEWIQLYNLGWGSHRIASKYDISIPTVQKYLKKANVFNGNRTRDTRIKNFDELIRNEKVIVVNGKLFESKKRCDLKFSLKNLNGIKVIPKFDANLNRVFLIPNKYGNTIYHNNSRNTVGVGTYIPITLRNQQAEMTHKKVLVYISLSKFGISITDTILDEDGKTLAKVLLENGWNLFEYRLTQGGDLSIISPSGKKYFIEITRETRKILTKNKSSRRWDFTNRLLGKMLQNKVYSDKNNCDFTIFVLNSINRKRLFGIFFKCAKYLNVKLLWTDFAKNWENEVANYIIEFDSKNEVASR